MGFAERLAPSLTRAQMGSVTNDGNHWTVMIGRRMLLPGLLVAIRRIPRSGGYSVRGPRDEACAGVPVPGDGEFTSRERGDLTFSGKPAFAVPSMD